VAVADSDRERAIAELREHFACGRLTLEEFSSRSDRALVADSRAELRTALRGLPVSVDDLVDRGRTVFLAIGRGAALVVFTGAYLFFSLMLAFAVGLTLLLHGASTGALLAILAVWLVPTYFLSRFWRSARPARPRH
jgi:hypothetical protein